MQYTIGIDIGTSATKTALFDLSGNMVASFSSEYPLSQPQNGWAEQNPEDWYQAAVQTLKQVMQTSGADKNKIAGIGLSGQMHGLVMLDENYCVLRPAILWCDQRTEEECRQLTDMLGPKLIEITANPALTGFTAGKILWVKNHEPHIFARCRYILLPKDYVRFRLTGALATDVTDASGMQLLDVKNRCWSQTMLDALGLREDMLGKVYESSQASGYIAPQIAALTGLREGTPVAAGAGDNEAAAVGTGVIFDNTAFTTIGTSGVVFAHTSTPVIDPQGRVHTFCAAVPNTWHVMGVTQGAGLSIQWMKNTFFTKEAETAKAKGISPYALLDEMAESSPIGANKLLFLPYLMGERTPHLDPNARGVFFGLSGMHQKADIIRAVCEGVCYSLRNACDVLREMGLSITDMTACGGGASSAFLRQMLCDNYNIPVKTITSNQGGALGAAILGGVAGGAYSSVEQGVHACIRTKSTTAPNPQSHERYTQMYHQYNKLYPALKENFMALSHLEW